MNHSFSPLANDPQLLLYTCVNAVSDIMNDFVVIAVRKLRTTVLYVQSECFIFLCVRH